MSLFSSFSRKTAPRCEHLSPTGRQCSQPACSSHPTLCFVHKPKSEPVPVEKPHRTPAGDSAFLAEITQVCGDLETPEQVRRALSLTLKAFVSRQISRETAGTTTYILQMLLRSQREIAYHKKLEQEAAAKLSDNDRTHIVLNMPTADRSDDPAPEPVAQAYPAYPEERREERRAAAFPPSVQSANLPSASTLPVAQACPEADSQRASACALAPNTTTQTNSSQPKSLKLPPPIAPPPIQAPPYDAEEQRWRAMTRGAIFRQR